ncbi:MAG TPA: universal stress protein [Gemmatimonadaceae bacterium]
MYRTIAVPLDGSDLAERAIAVAGALAKRDGAEVRVLHVHTPVPILSGAGELVVTQLRSTQREYIERTAANAAAQFGIRATAEELDGDVAAAICAEVAHLPADLVVMTTHGRTGASRFWLGSVADAVMRHITVPVLMLRASEESVSAVSQIRTVVMPIDGSTLASEIVSHAIDLGSVGCRYTLVRVVQPVPTVIGGTGFAPPAVVPDADATNAALREATADVDRLAARLRQEHSGLQVDSVVRVAPGVAAELLEIERERQPDVLAIATHGRGLSRVVMGSVADKLLRGGSSAMLVWHPPHD